MEKILYKVKYVTIRRLLTDRMGDVIITDQRLILCPYIFERENYSETETNPEKILKSGKDNHEVKYSDIYRLTLRKGFISLPTATVVIKMKERGFLGRRKMHDFWISKKEDYEKLKEIFTQSIPDNKLVIK